MICKICYHPDPNTDLWRNRGNSVDFVDAFNKVVPRFLGNNFRDYLKDKKHENT